MSDDKQIKDEKELDNVSAGRGAEEMERSGRGAEGLGRIGEAHGADPLRGGRPITEE